VPAVLKAGPIPPGAAAADVRPVVLQRGTPEAVTRELGRTAGPLLGDSSWL
jgi:hypothetical protein